MKHSLLLAALTCFVAPLSIHTVAHAQEQKTAAETFGSRARMGKVARSGKGWKASALYPIFRADTSLARYAGWQARLEAEKQTKAQAKDFQKEFATGIMPVQTYEFTLTPRLNFYGTNMISMEQVLFYNTGGAHPNSTVQTFNYGMSGTRPKLLTLGDFFRPNSNYRVQVAAQVMAKLKAQGAEWVQDGTAQKLTTAQLNNFSVAPDGLTWIFSPYEMGPYAAGFIEAKLTLRELGPEFRRELLKR